MRLLILLSLISSMTFSAGCVSQGTLDRAKATAIELGKDAVGAAGEKIKSELIEKKDEAIKEIDARSAEKLKEIIAADTDLSDAEKGSLIGNIDGRAAGGIGGLGALASIAFAYAKAKAAAKVRKALGLVVKSVEELPTEAAEAVRAEVAKRGGSALEIKNIISEAKA